MKCVSAGLIRSTEEHTETVILKEHGTITVQVDYHGVVVSLVKDGMTLVCFRRHFEDLLSSQKEHDHVEF